MARKRPRNSKDVPIIGGAGLAAAVSCHGSDFPIGQAGVLAVATKDVSRIAARPRKRAFLRNAKIRFILAICRQALSTGG